MAEEPQINDRYPINQMLSPPIVASPIPDCAEAVYVTGFVPHARVRVFANFTDLLAEEAPPFGFAEMRLNRPVKLGESITATQTVENFESPHSGQPVTVSAVPESAVQNTKPDVGDDLYECGIVVPVSNLVPGVRVQVTENNVRIGKAPAAQSWHPVRTRALHATRHVSARQIACEGTDHEVGSPPADSVDVKAAPNPVPSPIPPDKEAVIRGDD